MCKWNQSGFKTVVWNGYFLHKGQLLVWSSPTLQTLLLWWLVDILSKTPFILFNYFYQACLKCFGEQSRDIKVYFNIFKTLRACLEKGLAIWQPPLFTSAGNKQHQCWLCWLQKVIPLSGMSNPPPLLPTHQASASPYHNPHQSLALLCYLRLALWGEGAGWRRYGQEDLSTKYCYLPEQGAN